MTTGRDPLNAVGPATSTHGVADGRAVARSTGRPSSAHVQRKIRTARNDVTTAQPARTASGYPCEKIEAPSLTTLRRASLKALMGRRRMAGCTIRGKRLDEKKTPESTIIGSVTTLMRPFAVSLFWARDAQRRPRPAKHQEPSSA